MSERDHKTISEIEHNAYLFGIIMEILKEKGCTSENETVHVPTLVADFINGLQNEIATLEKEIKTKDEQINNITRIKGKKDGN